MNGQVADAGIDVCTGFGDFPLLLSRFVPFLGVLEVMQSWVVNIYIDRGCITSSAAEGTCTTLPSNLYGSFSQESLSE